MIFLGYMYFFMIEKMLERAFDCSRAYVFSFTIQVVLRHIYFLETKNRTLQFTSLPGHNVTILGEEKREYCLFYHVLFRDFMVLNTFLSL